ncbi:DUF1818 family protein [Limnoraphis robusta]|uniref:DUF1818 family protein n=1 Tax=Limnoraphis robusta CCNP1315 TaxID=3110306 RepID=A0ABU5U3H5_9CYAN|nr:DUF1818 family protein [Limnoraphis robusta]MEA5499545.1 DUF1818 family protein [Limnoraphis robusta BA-68 BA1]MEA5521674.1 DUF1818 family protein [Limnoraphis robusta CCNP1315]MEA5547056.1 DUF1818 family protein [Limnoraphis robusta CCNP1324]
MVSVDRILKTGTGWRLGWNPTATEYQGLVGGEHWAIELTAAEFNDFCRLLTQLSHIISQMASELMDSEKIACDAESDLLWMQVEGYPHVYGLQFILNTGRRGEGSWPPEVVSELIQATKILGVY